MQCKCITWIFFAWLEKLELDDTANSHDQEEGPSAVFVRRWNAGTKLATKKRAVLQRKGSNLLQAAGHAAALTKDKENSEFILKPLDKTEVAVYEELWKDGGEDPLQKYISRFGGTIKMQSAPGAPQQEFLRISNLLQDFAFANVMDCKLGVRSFEEKEASDTKLREDLYQKLMKSCPEQASEEDHAAKAITKFKYLNSRDNESSSRSLGFRVDGITCSRGPLVDPKKLQKLKTMDEICHHLVKVLPRPGGGTSQEDLVTMRTLLVRQILVQLGHILDVMHVSTFVRTHQFVGCSLLFVVDQSRAAVRLIDFAKTKVLPEGVVLDHERPWELGNHEDGVIFGVQNLIECFKRVLNDLRPHSPFAYERNYEVQQGKLVALLIKHGVEVSLWKAETARSVDELLWELHVRKSCTLEEGDDGILRRIVSIVRMWPIYRGRDGKPKVLMELTQKQQGRATELTSTSSCAMVSALTEPGEQRLSRRPIGKKIRAGSTWEDAVQLALEAFVNISPDTQKAAFKVLHGTHRVKNEALQGSENAGFFGLLSTYCVHEVNIEVLDAAEKLADIGLPECHDFVALESGDGHNTVWGKGVRHWTWASLEDSGCSLSYLQA